MATNDEILIEQPFDMTYYDRPYRCLPRAQYDELARKAKAWDAAERTWLALVKRHAERELASGSAVIDAGREVLKEPDHA